VKIIPEPRATRNTTFNQRTCGVEQFPTSLERTYVIMSLAAFKSKLKTFTVTHDGHPALLQFFYVISVP